ncbi:MAG: hypothetical protein UU34_C0001G0005 [Candidatus Curtissbacteria bacterium GW2011_GWA1_41_11]|uniref:DNA polymerase III delta N-terminal domain-containing protein n=1 Tax=Candidatus Curtissbacteria bacterium GW2011_GWA1_41_11 TaxID=1618409 RepID=A0A0G0UGI8_9BACT|nr:MAG: hypothetical protein UU34_C0001G0005 [Candidatus Curtissbacteria bacterium GW2011_GWA1_41_11]
MIHILHGEDSIASYNRLQLILSNFQDFEKVKFDERATKDDFMMALFTRDLIDEKKIVSCVGFISLKKIGKEDFKNIPLEKTVIFWEKKKVNVKQLASIKTKIQIEEFKTPPTIFYFLDSISQGSKQPINWLNKFTEDETRSLFWHLTSRIYLLVLAKLKISLHEVNAFNGRPVQDWQWNKITSQADKFNLATLKKIFYGLLRIDYLIKSGKTNLEEKTLVSTLFLKYLSP